MEIDFSGIANHQLWTAINSRRHKISLWFINQSRDWWWSGDQRSFISGPPHNRSGGSLIPFDGYFTILACIICNMHSQQLAESWYCLSCGMWVIMVEKAKCKPLELPLPRKIVNQNQYCIPGGIYLLGRLVPLPILERCRGDDSYHIPIQLAYLACTVDRWIFENDNGLSKS